MKDVVLTGLPAPRKSWRLGAISVIAAVTVVVALVGATSSSITASAAEPPGRSLVVKTSDGIVRGEKATGAQKFLGLPYAQPPVGDLRFAAPAAPTPWKGARDATTPSAACFQGGLGSVESGQATSEDCLYLDVYRPAPFPRDVQLPVIVWIHGGGFGGGSGGLFDASELAARTQSIVVSINYRLGALGSLRLTRWGSPRATSVFSIKLPLFGG